MTLPTLPTLPSTADASAVRATPRVPLWAASWVGLPFVPKGRDPLVGLDCWGLVRAVYAQRYGIALPLWDDYDDIHDRRALSDAISASRTAVVPIARTDAREGDLVILNLAGYPCHVGLVLDDPWFLHARDGRRSGIERLDSVAWANRVEGFYRWPR
jgi:cell wall-associated NlpC family hydrolase